MAKNVKKKSRAKRTYTKKDSAYWKNPRAYRGCGRGRRAPVRQEVQPQRELPKSRGWFTRFMDFLGL